MVQGSVCTKFEVSLFVWLGGATQIHRQTQRYSHKYWNIPYWLRSSRGLQNVKIHARANVSGINVFYKHLGVIS